MKMEVIATINSIIVDIGIIGDSSFLLVKNTHILLVWFLSLSIFKLSLQMLFSFNS